MEPCGYGGSDSEAAGFLRCATFDTYRCSVVMCLLEVRNERVVGSMR